ncbi:hypothetical protein HYE67_000353 [Fusarium culmorum]|uniref:Alkaline ceramidase YPC1 n=1 Tax=Fusarium culmorum TaxID=5516 RepID=A0A7S8HR30_FUSCU|nr:hypothetical protein HYE67_000353 [Fusarium culmorum]
MVEPVWGPQTSYLNFCEEDYIVTRYIAEFINTLSSLAYSQLCAVYHIYLLTPLVVYGIYGLASCDKFPTVSASFYIRTKLVGLALSTLFTAVMITHVVLDEFLLHAISFGLGVLIIARRSLQIISQRTLDLDTRCDLRNISIAGITFFIFGYIVWLIDDWACRYLTDIRHTVGLPFAFLFELHGWWHFFTAIGGYIAVIVVDSITLNEKVDNPTSRLAWPVPLVARLMASSVTAKPA